jgi:TRAP-type mannitol/chloroaromatic compound transport system substrate-binding protein
MIKKQVLIGMSVVVFSVFAVLIFHGAAVAADKDVVTWRVQTPWPPNIWQHKSAEIWAEDVEKLSGGKLKIKLFSSGELVPAFEIYDSVRTGTLDAGHGWAGYNIGKFPACTFFAATPAFTDFKGYMTWVYSAGGKELWQEIYGDKVKVFPAGMLYAEGGGWSNKKITKLQDYKGLKYRTVLIWGEILNEIGASVVTLPAADIVPSLQRGTLDAAEFSTPVTDLPLGFHEVCDYWHGPGLHQISGFLELIINPKSWEKLSEQSKTAVEYACRAAITRQLAPWLIADAKAVQEMQAGETELVHFPREMQQEILERFQKKYENHKNPMFRKCWKSFKDFMSYYGPYNQLQSVEAYVEIWK